MQESIIYTISDLKTAVSNKTNVIIVRGNLANKIIKCFPKSQIGSCGATMGAVEWTPDIIVAIGYLFLFVCVGISTFIALHKNYTCKVRVQGAEVTFERNGYEKN